MKDVTAITVAYNTPTLIRKAITSMRWHYPDIAIIIVDGSPKDSECHHVVDELAKIFHGIKVVHANHNIGHGPGMDAAILLSKTKYVLLFGGKHTAMNLGISIATTEYHIFIPTSR